MSEPQVPLTAQPVAIVESWTNGSYSRNYKIKWLTDVAEGTKLYAVRPQEQEAKEQSDDAFAQAMLNDLIRRGASPVALSLAAQLFGVGPCGKCGYRKLHCRCDIAAQAAQPKDAA